MSAGILVYEHVTAGGCAGPVPVSLADAGRAMWRAVVDDLAAIGAKVWTTAGDCTPIDGDDRHVTIAPAGELEALMHDMAGRCDGAIIIAPETGDVLATWIERFTQWNLPLLNCSPGTVRLCGDKRQLSRHLEKHGVPTIPTKAGQTAALIDGVAAALQAEGGAYVIKPRDGAGCETTFVCRSAEDVEAVRAVVTQGEWIAQPFVPGRAVSMSFVANGQGVRPLLAGEQVIEGDRALRYIGGRIPLEMRLAERATFLATQAVRTLAGLRGFIGVDLILGDSPREDVVVEVNPRLTVSYCGLRMLSATNLLHAMMEDQGPVKWRRGSVAFDHAGRIASGGA